MEWNAIIKLYQQDGPDHEFAAFLMRRYYFLSSCIKSKWPIVFFGRHIEAEYNLCCAIIEDITETAVQDVMIDLNKNRHA